ncbi:MAG TPA: methyltransferase domain-containing protein [Patescibacteria group bacterium]|nr:methyltransferase domain-containing protein [Patescibacteria group bacterium]
MAIHESAARGFSAGADAYERGRPDYSPDAVERLVRELGIGPETRVLDLAAGTGKLTREIASRGAELVAVEPIAEMRAKLEARLPQVEAVEGTAERIPLPNHSVDAVVVGQAFHWFDSVRAVSEIRRVLRPGGGVGLIWQVRDASRPWTARLEEIIDRADDGHPRFRTGAWREGFDRTALFEPLHEATYHTIQRGSPETIIDRVASISYVAAMPDSRRRSVLDEVRDLLATDPETAGAEFVELPYGANIYWARARLAPEGPSTGLVAAVNTSPGGVPKRPIASARIHWRGLEGDGHSKPEPIHGTREQAVCLYAFEAIERVRSDGQQAFPGAYGENLTIVGLDWGGLRRGDRLRIGEAGPLLHLTDYATPCDTQARWFVDGRYGRISARTHPEDARWYASVVEEGRVAPGDLVRLIRTA